MLLEMAAEAAPERTAIGPRDGGLTYGQLLARVGSAAAWLQTSGGERVAVLDHNSEAVPLLLFGAGLLGRPFVPLNYRLAPDQLSAIMGRVAPATVVIGAEVTVPGPVPEGLEVVGRDEFLAATRTSATRTSAAGPGQPVVEEPLPVDPESVAVLLFTSGTTGTPKAAVLRHRHLVSYIISTVEFLGAGEDEATLVSVPPYHVAGISALLSSIYAGRRIVQMAAFDPDRWVDTVREQSVTHAMVVPTMLGRILDSADRRGLDLPSLRHLSYGGGRMPVTTIQRAMEALPGVDFVNAYGLTETSSTIAVLGPDDHRDAFVAADGPVRRRLGSVGRPLPSLEVEIRDPDGSPVPTGASGEIHVRGEQVSGEYLGAAGLDADGWFATRDGGFLDVDGFLFVEGRLDDVIVRGGENLSPGEIEDVLAAHPTVVDVAVVGIPDQEWGEQVAAAVVLVDGAVGDADELRAWVRARLRSSRTPTRIAFVPALPYNETGKLLRRVLRDELSAAESPPPAPVAASSATSSSAPPS
jgi:acyl-CoA synthetase (AMP-forming)/AMP-acid ligase II